ncbi:MAG: AEC family transporter [Clostridia bacterium]|nr:AEC family transporter [Clostridia bacterium]
MTYFFPIVYNVALMFAMMIPGFIMKKLRLCPEGFGKGLSKLVLYIAQPALVFLAYIREFDMKILINSLWVLLVSVIIHIIFAAVAMLSFKKASRSARPMLRFATIFSNAAFMGIPLIGAVIEPVCPGATMYASIYNIVFNLFLWSLGVYICNEDRDTDGDGVDDQSYAEDIKEVHAKLNFGKAITKALLHPVTIAAALGLVFFIVPFSSFTPEYITESVVIKFILEALTLLKNLVVPLSMLIIGIRLADMSFKGILKDKYMFLFLLYRHVLLPLATLGLLKLLILIGLPMDQNAMCVCLILAAAPAASSATMFAEQYDCDSVYVSRLVTISTILSIITMPLVLLLV